MSTEYTIRVKRSLVSLIIIIVVLFSNLVVIFMRAPLTLFISCVVSGVDVLCMPVLIYGLVNWLTVLDMRSVEE